MVFFDEIVWEQQNLIMVFSIYLFIFFSNGFFSLLGTLLCFSSCNVEERSRNTITGDIERWERDYWLCV